jgi:hypothetical protein
MDQPTLTVDDSWVLGANGKPRPEEAWSPSELTHGDIDSARKFWTLVLLLAGRDHAMSVQFFPRLGEECLSCTVGGVNYTIVPPPQEFGDWLLHVGRNLSAGSTWRGVLWGWKARILRCQSSGVLTLVFRGNHIDWTVAFSPAGLVFYRRSDWEGIA